MNNTKFRIYFAKSVFTFFLITQIIFSGEVYSQDVIQVNKSTTKQTIWGFGGAANHPVQDLKTKLSAANQKIVLDKLFRTDGDNAGLSIIRLEINPFRRTDPDPNNREQYTIQPSEGVWDWNTDQYQRWFAQEAMNRTEGVHFMACPWSPPGWMKSNNSPVNGGSLKTEYYDTFATYMKTYVDHYRNVYGFDIRWVSVQNEPTNSTTYASCVYSNSAMNIVAAKVADEVHSLNQGVLVGAPEGATRGISANYMNAMSASTKGKLDYILTHDYTGANSSLAGFGKPVINTEVWSENYSVKDITITDGLRWANAIKSALVSRNEPGWLYWWLIDPNGNEQGIIVLNGSSYTFPKRLYAIGQFSRFMREGDVRVDATSTNSNLAVVSTINAYGRASILVINNSSSAIEASIKGLSADVLEVYRTSATENLLKLDDLVIADNTATASFAAKSITTLVEISNCINAAPTITKPGDVTFEAGIGPQTINLEGITDGDDCAQGVTITASSSNPNAATVGNIDYTSCNSTGSIQIIPVAMGTTEITVTATDGGTNDCAPVFKSVSFKITVSQSGNVSVNMDALQDIQIYPNPTNDHLIVEMNNKAYTKLTLVDLSGRSQLSQPIARLQTSCELNLSGFEKGVYLLNLSNDKESVTRKVLKK